MITNKPIDQISEPLLQDLETEFDTFIKSYEDKVAFFSIFTKGQHIKMASNLDKEGVIALLKEAIHFIETDPSIPQQTVLQ